MKQSLQLKLGQNLALTPQLQQAIKLLQLSTLDLQQAIDEALETNPLLELEEESVDRQPELLDEITSLNFSEESISSSDEAYYSEEKVDSTEASVNSEIETSWDSTLPTSAPSGQSGLSDEWMEKSVVTESLHDQLYWQLNLTRFSETDQKIAEAFIDSVDHNGRLIFTPEEILASINLPEVELDEVMAVLHRLQHFEPTGVFAKDLRECLLLQLRQMSADTPFREIAGAIVSRHIDHIATVDPKKLAKRLRTEEDSLRGAVLLIKSLDPTPGARIDNDNTEYIIPDIFVARKKDRWRVELNPDTAPKLRINSTYAELAGHGNSANDRSYIKENLQEAKWFMRSLQSRNETLLKVASKIVEHQQAFLESGEEAMKPLVLADIAEEIDMHESTVSRATTRKYMHTPRGIYELKFFFSSHVRTTEGGECSSIAIKALIKKLVQGEDTSRPLSDNKLGVLLKDNGVVVARRTVAKYREQLGIPPSNERKRLI